MQSGATSGLNLIQPNKLGSAGRSANKHNLFGNHPRTLKRTAAKDTMKTFWRGERINGKNQGPKGQSSHMPKTGTRSHQKFITALVCTICTHLKSFNLVHSGTHTHRKCHLAGLGRFRPYERCPPAFEGGHKQGRRRQDTLSGGCR